MTYQLNKRSRLTMTFFGGALLSLGLIAGCGDSGNSVPDVSQDEFAEYEQKLADAQARANEKEGD